MSTRPPIDPVVRATLENIERSFDDCDDIGGLPFGEYAKVDLNGDHIVVRHETDDSPVVRITVERIA
jgi:hypothetical protein